MISILYHRECTASGTFPGSAESTTLTITAIRDHTTPVDGCNRFVPYPFHRIASHRNCQLTFLARAILIERMNETHLCGSTPTHAKKEKEKDRENRQR